MSSAIGDTQVVSDVIYLGMYNPGPLPLQFTLKLINSEEHSSSTEINKLVIIITGCVVGALLVLSFVLSVIKSRQQQELDRAREQRHMQQDSRYEVRVEPQAVQQKLQRGRGC